MKHTSDNILQNPSSLHQRTWVLFALRVYPTVAQLLYIIDLSSLDIQDATHRQTACEQAVCKTVWHIPLLCVQWKTPDDGRRDNPKHVDFHPKNKFEKSVHLVGFIIRIYHDAWSHERQIQPYITSCGGGGSKVVKVLRYKSEGRWFDPRWCHWNSSLT
jgi:hypothetical protein